VKIAFAFLAALPLLGGDLETFTDNALNYTQRNTACFRLRGNRSPEAVASMLGAMENASLQACAAANLRSAGAYTELLGVLKQSKDPSARAAAARELGTAQKAEYLPALGEAAGDRDVLVASNAIEGLMRYSDRSSASQLRKIALLGGIQSTLALDILIDWHDPEVIAIGRRLVSARNPADQLVGIRAIGQAGDASDLPQLRELAKNDVEMNAGSRGFGLMPAVSIARAARTAIAGIEERASMK
jgi:HEAT repeat protein